MKLIGKTFTTTQCGDLEVISRLRKDTYQVVFKSTGHIQTAYAAAIKRGQVWDGSTEKPRNLPVQPGDVFITNRYGSCTVVEYIDSKNVIVKFNDSGSVQKVQLDALRKGLVQDKARRKAESTKKDEARLAAWVETQRGWEVARGARAVAAALKKVCKLKERAAKVEAADAKDMALIGTRYIDRLGMEATIVGVTTCQLGKFYTLTYSVSGNTYTVRANHLAVKAAVDTLSPYYEVADKAYYSGKSKTYYEENRRSIVKAALERQRRNVEATRTRNRNRHARRKGATGTHTKEETAALLESQDNRCASCDCVLHSGRGGRHLDHIMPLKLGGSNGIENLQWLCAFCNMSKGSKHPDAWKAYKETEDFRSALRARRS